MFLPLWCCHPPSLLYLPLYLSTPCPMHPRIRISAVYLCASSFLSPTPTNLFPSLSVSNFFLFPHPSKWILHKELTSRWDWSLLCHQITVTFSKPLKTIPITSDVTTCSSFVTFCMEIWSSLEGQRQETLFFTSNHAHVHSGMHF